jgi:hypothetical protein
VSQNCPRLPQNNNNGALGTLFKDFFIARWRDFFQSGHHATLPKLIKIWSKFMKNG